MSKTKAIHLQPSHVKAYRFVQKYIQKNIASPNVPEIAAHIKLTMRQTYRLIEDLCELGYMSKDLYKNRSIKILKDLESR